MKTMKWLLRREFWEHKGGFVWAPLVAAAIMIVLVGGVVGYGIASGKIGHERVVVRVDGQEVQNVSLTQAVPPEVRAQIGEMAANNYLAVGAPILIVLPVVAFFYCLAALYDDRRDRSILFWKSLPISDSETVLSKLVTVLVIAPLISIGIAVGTALVILLIGGLGASAQGIGLFSMLLTKPQFYLAPLYLVAVLPVYIMWALPTAGWLMLVSSWAKSKVFLWAVGVPLMAAVLLKWLDYLLGMYSGTTIHANVLIDTVLETLLFGLIPGTWFLEEGAKLPAPGRYGMDALSLLSYSYSTLSKPAVWGGVVAGVAMLFGAVRLRRWRDEG